MPRGMRYEISSSPLAVEPHCREAQQCLSAHVHLGHTSRMRSLCIPNLCSYHPPLLVYRRWCSWLENTIPFNLCPSADIEARHTIPKAWEARCSSTCCVRTRYDSLVPKVYIGSQRCPGACPSTRSVIAAGYSGQYTASTSTSLAGPDAHQ